MSNFLPFTGPIFDFFVENYDALEYELLTHAVGKNIGWTKAQSVTTSKGYAFDNGDLYRGKIDCVLFKIARVCHDEHERRATNWLTDETPYKWWFRENKPEQYKLLPTWDKLITTFDDYIEECFINVAYPAAGIASHLGVEKHYMRAHVCFQENQGFTFNINGEERKWTKGIGSSFMFDDGNLPHFVKWTEEENTGTQPRIVCILDIKKTMWE